MEIQQIISKVASQIKGDWIDAWNYLSKFGIETLKLSVEEKNLLRHYLSETARRDNTPIPLYDGDPFPRTREEQKQIAGSRALGRQWTKYNKSIRQEIERVR